MIHTHALDPTRTTMLRRDYVRAFEARFSLLRGALAGLVAGGFFGSGPEVLLELAAIELFAQAVQAETERLVWETDPEAGDPGGGWLLRFVAAAVGKGLLHADNSLSGAGYALLPSASGGVSLFQATIDRLAAENFELVRGATADMVAGIRGALVDGVGQRLTTDELAALINGRVDAIGLNRARTIARTEVVRAHAEATLDRLEQHGVGGVSALVEWDEGQHCPICTALQTADNGYGPGVYTVAQARGIIPVHPNCQCAWLPVVAPLVPNVRVNTGALVVAVIAALRQRSRLLDWLLR